jgi:hypothetical protein
MPVREGRAQAPRCRDLLIDGLAGAGMTSRFRFVLVLGLVVVVLSHSHKRKKKNKEQMSKYDLLHPSAQAFLDSLDSPSTNPNGLLGKQQLEENGAFSLSDHFVIPMGLTVDAVSTEHAKHYEHLLLSSSPSPTPTSCPNLSFWRPFEEINESTCLPRQGTSFGRQQQGVSLTSLVVLFVRQVMPFTIAGCQLFFRLFAPGILILAVLYLLIESRWIEKSDGKTGRTSRNIVHSLIAFLAVLCTAIFMTDSMYVMEYGRVLLSALHVMVSFVVLWRSHAWKWDAGVLIAPLTAIAIYHMLTSDLELTAGKLEPGFYYDKTNPVTAAIVENWPDENRAYTPSPWVVSKFRYNIVSDGLLGLGISSHHIDCSYRW